MQTGVPEAPCCSSCGDGGECESDPSPAMQALAWGNLQAGRVQDPFWKIATINEAVRQAPARAETTEWHALETGLRAAQLSTSFMRPLTTQQECALAVMGDPTIFDPHFAFLDDAGDDDGGGDDGDGKKKDDDDGWHPLAEGEPKPDWTGYKLPNYKICKPPEVQVFNSKTKEWECSAPPPGKPYWNGTEWDVPRICLVITVEEPPPPPPPPMCCCPVGVFIEPYPKGPNSGGGTYRFDEVGDAFLRRDQFKNGVKVLAGVPILPTAIGSIFQIRYESTVKMEKGSKCTRHWYETTDDPMSGPGQSGRQVDQADSEDTNSPTVGPLIDANRAAVGDPAANRAIGVDAPHRVPGFEKKTVKIRGEAVLKTGCPGCEDKTAFWFVEIDVDPGHGPTVSYFYFVDSSGAEGGHSHRGGQDLTGSASDLARRNFLRSRWGRPR